jgi:hypothetical protein
MHQNCGHHRRRRPVTERRSIFGGDSLRENLRQKWTTPRAAVAPDAAAGFGDRRSALAKNGTLARADQRITAARDHWRPPLAAISVVSFIWLLMTGPVLHALRHAVIFGQSIFGGD